MEVEVETRKGVIEAATGDPEVLAELLDGVRSIEPVIRKYQPWQEEHRQMAPEVFEALGSVGLFDIWRPKALGGLELEPLAANRVFDAVNEIDGSTGWAIGNAGSIEPPGMMLPQQTIEEVYSTPGQPLAGGWFPPGAAVPVPGGYKVTGHWTFSSLCHHAKHITALAFVTVDGEIQIAEDGGPELMFVIFDREDVEIIPNWQTMGMRGTGSHDTAVTDVFIPEHRAAPFAYPETRLPAYQGTLYTCFPWPYNGALVSTVLSQAQAAINALIDLAQGKVPNYTESKLSERALAQHNVARAQAAVSSARAGFDAVVADIWKSGEEGNRPTLEQGRDSLLAAIHAVVTGGEALELVHETAGSSAFREEMPFEQLFRDGRTITQHAYASSSRFQSCGQLLFGLESDWKFFYV